MSKSKSAPASATQEENQYTSLEYDVHIYPSKGDGAQKATATVNIGRQFAIRGIKIMETICSIWSIPTWTNTLPMKTTLWPRQKQKNMPRSFPKPSLMPVMKTTVKTSFSMMPLKDSYLQSSF